MTLEQQIHDWQRIHDVADQRGGQPVDQAVASVAEYLRQKHMLAIDINQLGLAASTIIAGLEQIESGRVELGIMVIRNAAEYVRAKIEEARS